MGVVMKFCAVSDLHGNVGVIPKIISCARKFQCDFIVFCGDLTNFGSVEDGIEVLEKLSESGLELLFVPGNCDPKGLIDVKIKDVMCIHGKLFCIDSFGFIGVGGSTPTPFGTPFELSENEIWSLLERIVGEIDDFNRVILVSHDPPYNTVLDFTFAGFHVGSKSIRKFILQYKPLMGIHGHIHEGKGVDKLNGVYIINPGASANGYMAIVNIESDLQIKYKFLNVFDI